MPITNFVFFKIYNQALLEKLIDKTWGDENPAASINYGRILLMDFDIWLSKKFNSSDNDEYCNLQNFKSFLKNYYQLENEKKMIQEDNIKKGRIEVGLEKDDNRIYLSKMSGFDWINEIEKARGEKIISDIILPTHNFEMLKEYRLKNVFEADKTKLKEDNRKNKIKTDDTDIKLLYIQFLKGELNHADYWIEKINNLSTKTLNQADIIQIEKYKLFLKDEIERTEKSTNLRPQKKIVLSYQWQGDAEKELPELYSKLVKDKFIDDNQSDLKAFTAIFTGQPIETIKPIKWTNSNRLLAYFLDTAFNSQDWQSIAGNGKLFLNYKGKILTANDLSVAKKGFDFGKPKGYEKIDKILSEIKNTKNIKTS